MITRILGLILVFVGLVGGYDACARANDPKALPGTNVFKKSIAVVVGLGLASGGLGLLLAPRRVQGKNAPSNE